MGIDPTLAMDAFPFDEVQDLGMSGSGNAGQRLQQPQDPVVIHHRPTRKLADNNRVYQNQSLLEEKRE